MPDSLTHEQAGSPHDDEPPDQEYEGPPFEEMDPSGRYGRFRDVLGRGACKVVFKAFDIQEGTEVAWNQVRLSDLMCAKDVTKEDRDRLFAEIRVLKALKHKNIMSFYDSWFEPKTLTVNFITELFTSGTLRQYRKRHKHVDSEVLKRWAWQILCGLVYLHGHNPPIIHRDLKCDNIFINGSDGVVKIGDLGLATMLRSRTAPQSVLGTPEFMAPELYEEDYDDRVDVYSFGMALLELATLEYPYAECTNAAQIYRKVSLGVRPQGLQKVTSPELAEFINTCIANRPQRPRARQLLKHPYFDTVRQTLAPCKSELLLAAAGVGTASMEAATALVEGGASSTRIPARPPVEGGELLADVAVAAAGPPSVASSTTSNSIGGPPSRTTSGLPADATAIAAATIAATAAGAAVTMTPTAADAGAGAEGNAIASVGTADGSDAASVRSQRSNASELAATLSYMDIATGFGGTAAATGATATDAGSHMGSRATSRGPSPPGSPFNATGGISSPGAAISPQGSDQEEVSAGQCRCAATDRCFRVMGKVRSDEADQGRTLLNLRLRIQEPDGTNRTVEFEFDLTHDTVGSVASEMVSDLELSPEDADAITVAMKREISKLSASMEGEASKNLKTAAAVLQAGLMENALLQANSATLQDEEESSQVEEGVEIDSGTIKSDNDGVRGSDEGRESSVLLMATLSNASSHHTAPHHQQQQQQPPPIIIAPTVPQSASEAFFHENWEEPSQQLRSACSASSLHSEASAHSAHSTHSTHSIQSSPAQLAVPNDSTKNAFTGNGNGNNGGGGGAVGPPQANMRLARTVSMDRQFNGNGNNVGYSISDRYLPERNLSAGALSPGSGVLSPVSSNGNADKRSLSKLFENLQEVAYEREQCVTPPPVPTQRPPLPPSVSIGGHTSGGRLPHTKSSPPGVFAAMLAGVNTTGTDREGVASASGHGAPVQNLSEGLLRSVHGNGNGPNGTGAGSTGSLSQPGSVDGDAILASTTGGVSGAAGQRLLAKGAAFKDKETLRKQAADAMKAVELRSLTLLQGNLGGSKNTRGTPMLATKQNGSCANLTGVNGNNGGGGSATEGGGSCSATVAAAVPPPAEQGQGAAVPPEQSADTS
ncbi:putative serine/threonine-protein kinase WNK3 [Nannochloris sp. 'desiccata']|nr:hypothetical protein KSW81_001593 [Chlorella desiccata (nom. nud.)]KAH7616742.1 putative serine/threonine-protein kinase WNK3 [Chlorella desiccata (nom. nud.)]